MKRFTAKNRCAAVVALAMLTAAGCDRAMFIQSDDGQNLPAPSGGVLSARAVRPVADVPLPEGFVAVQPRSRSSTGPGGARSVDYYYQGRASFPRIIDFYRQSLAEAGWRPLSEDVRGSSAVLRYQKTLESLELRIDKPERVATVRVKISPGQYPVAP